MSFVTWPHVPADIELSSLHEYTVIKKFLLESSFLHELLSLNQNLISVSVDFYYQALERTYLGYLRTSLALSIVGIVIAQLFRLQHTENPSVDIGFFVIGIPLAATCIVAAMLVMFLGCYRFWRQQNAMLRGKVHAGGWELDMVAFIALIVCFLVQIPATATN